jgi:predicted TIM-barrel fold metal-dependent hydrolase
MIVDTHAHVYSPDEVAYPPISEPLRPAVGTGSPEHLQEEMKASGVDRAVLIQTSSFYRWDNRYLRDTAAASRDWAVGVCTLNPDDPHSPDILYSLVSRYNVKGLRSVPAADGSYDHPGVRRLWSAATSLGITVAALIPLEVADELAKLLDDFTDLRVILDHCLSLRAGPKYEATVSKVLELSRRPNLYAKLTFLPTGSAERYPFRDMHDACKRFVEAFGPERCIWGSDFPTALWCPKVTYEGHIRIFREELGLSRKEQDAILGDTAERLWFAGG